MAEFGWPNGLLEHINFISQASHESAREFCSRQEVLTADPEMRICVQASTARTSKNLTWTFGTTPFSITSGARAYRFLRRRFELFPRVGARRRAILSRAPSR
ncbi:MAG: hypothetical protein ACP5XB_15895, partial [Isosphaeraceae bacterium]